MGSTRLAVYKLFLCNYVTVCAWLIIYRLHTTFDLMHSRKWLVLSRYHLEIIASYIVVMLLLVCLLSAMVLLSDLMLALSD